MQIPTRYFSSEIYFNFLRYLSACELSFTFCEFDTVAFLIISNVHVNAHQWCTVTWPCDIAMSIMMNVTWQRFDQSAKRLALGRATVNRWRTIVRLNMSHSGCALVWHVQPRVVIFPCRTQYRVSYVLSSDQLQESWIICKLKSFSPVYLHDLNTLDRRVIFGVSKTLCDFGHKNSFTEE